MKHNITIPKNHSGIEMLPLEVAKSQTKEPDKLHIFYAGSAVPTSAKGAYS